MKAILLVLVISSLSVLASARADTPKPQPCDASWGACAVGRTDFQHPGRYLIDILFLNQDEMKQNVPLLGSGADGDDSGDTPYLQAVVEIGSTDVLLQVPANTGAPQQSFSIGKIAQPIGNDISQYYTREIVLNPGVQIESKSSAATQNYCDPGGVFGAVHYVQRITTIDSVITGATPEPFNLHSSRMKILLTYPALFGCK